MSRNLILFGAATWLLRRLVFLDNAVWSFCLVPPLSLLPDRLTLLQRIQDAASRGYTHYATGQVSQARWPAVETKFASAYETDLAKSTRSRRRRAGQAVSLLYGCEPPPYQRDAPVVWVLVATAGKGRVHAREQLREFASQRIEVDGYELVHDGVSWSWRLTQARYRYWRERIHSIAARAPERRQIGQDQGGEFDVEIERVMAALYNMPGFRLVRRQAGKLVAFANGEWRRLRPATGPQIRKQTFLPYVQRLPNQKPPRKPSNDA